MAEASSAVAERSAVGEDFSTVRVLVRRELVRFFRERSRVIGALLQPMIFWFVIGSGLSSTFVLPGDQGVDYLEYFYPGVVLMVVLFTAIFTTMSVIEDRHAGFLQGVLVAPGSRGAVVVGKSLGAASVAFVQSALFLLLAPLAGFSLMQIDWPLLVLALGTSSLALCLVGFGVAWWLDSTSGYHVVMSLVLLPLWILSGAMFPAPAGGWLSIVERVNPMSYAVSLVRRALYAGTPPPGTSMVTESALFELAVLVVFAVVCGVWATILVRRRR
jgi:daunorubicin resistance ABC transporter membrane protein